MSACQQLGGVDALHWTIPQFPFAVECPWAILEEIHGVVQEGFRKLSRGGVEVGGVLFGRKTDTSVQVLAWRPIACEHSRGPAFLLSDNDKGALTGLLEAASRAPQLQVLEPVGWFVSHTRAGLLMTEADLELFQHSFAEPWQVTLVYAPAKQGPSRAGFFVREGNGMVRTESSHGEFAVTEVRTPKAESVGVLPASARTPVSTRRRMRAEEPKLVSVEHARGRFWRIAVVAVALLLGAFALLAVPGIRGNPASQDPLQLKLLEAQGQLRIEWDGASGRVLQADGATLTITDGGPIAPIQLDQEALQSGSATYARVSEDVEVRLIIERAGQPPYQELARYVGSPVPKLETKQLRAARQGTARRLTEVQQLREQLQIQEKNVRELERTLKRLEAQWERESHHRESVFKE